MRIIQEVEEFEIEKDAEVEEVRGSNISLKNRLAKLELMYFTTTIASEP